MALKVRRMRHEAYTPTLNEKQILFYRANPVIACEELLGIKLIWLQRITLRMIWFIRFPLLNMGRGLGKSFMIAIASILMAMLYPKTKIGIVAPVFRQANYVFDAIDDIYANSDYLKSATSKASSRGSAQSVLRFHNGSFIEALPVGDGNKIRGRRYHIVFIDEYAQMDESIIKLVIRPMLNIKRGNKENKLIIASTAFYRWNHYWTLYLFYLRQMINGSKDYAIAEFDYIDLQSTKNSPYQIDMEIIKMQKNDMTYEEFAMENLGMFPADSVGFISAKLIDQCTPKLDPIEPEFRQPAGSRAVYVLGVDAARQSGGDNFAMVLLKLENGKRNLVYVKTLNGRTFQDMVSEIRDVLSKYEVIRVQVGAGGGGLTIKDLLAAEWRNENGDKMPPILDMDDDAHRAKSGLHILRIVNETNKKNNEMYMNLKADLQHKRLQFPVDVRTTERETAAISDVYREVLSTKRELMVLEAVPSGIYHKFVVPSKYKKDRATALVLAIDGALEVGRVDKEEAAGELPIGLWV